MTRAERSSGHLLQRCRAFMVSFSTTFIVLLLATTAPQPVLAGTVATFNQTDWSGGISALPATLTGWTAYSAIDPNLNAAADLVLGSTPDSVTHTSVQDFAFDYSSYPIGTSTVAEGGDVSMQLSISQNLTAVATVATSSGDRMQGLFATDDLLYVTTYGGNLCGNSGARNRLRRLYFADHATPLGSAGIMDFGTAGGFAIGEVYVDDLSETAFVSRLGQGFDIVLPNNSNYNYAPAGNATQAYAAGNYAYMVAGGALEIIDVTVLSAPTFESRYIPSNSAEDVVVSGNYAYLALGWAGVDIVDISTTSPFSVATVNEDASAVFVLDDLLYIVGSGLQVYDVANPTNPVKLGDTSSFNDSSKIQVTKGYAYIKDSSGSGAVIAYDVTDSSNPTLVAGGSLTALDTSVDFSVFGKYAYIGVDGNACDNNNPGGDVYAYDIGSYPTGAPHTYTSSVINIGGHTGYDNLDFSFTNPSTHATPVSIELRAGTDDTPDDGGWTGWQTAIATSGDPITGLGTNPYVQYRVNLATDDDTVTPVLHDVTINFSRSVSSGWLESSPYDTGVVANVLDSLSWTETLPAGTDVQIQIRTAADSAGSPGTWSAWTGPDGAANSYWNSANTPTAGGCTGAGAGPVTISCDIAPIFRDGVDDQWFQYRVMLTTTGAATPTFSDISIAYGTGTTSASKITITRTSALPLETDELGTITETFDVALDSTPKNSSPVVIDLYTTDIGAAIVTPSRLTFTNAGGGAAQTVTVTGVNDDVDDGTQSYFLGAAAAISSDDYFDDVIAADTFSMITLDDDAAGVTITPPTGLTTHENGATATFTIVLDSEPTQDVIINVASDNTDAGVLLNEIVQPVSSLPLTFTPANWNVAQTVTIRGVDDFIDQDPFTTYNIQFTASSPGEGSEISYDAFVIPDVGVTNTDDDSPGIEVCVLQKPLFNAVACTDPSVALVSTIEPNGFRSFRVKLAAQPFGTISFILTSDDPTEGFVSPALMTFDSTNWDTGVVGFLAGVNDDDVDGTVPYSIVTSDMLATDTVNDSAWVGFSIANIPAETVDDDGVDPTIEVAPTSGLVTTEDGGVAQFGIQLSRSPRAGKTVTIDLEPNFAGLDEAVVSPTSITFTEYDSAFSPKYVKITGLGDREFDPDENYRINTTLNDSLPTHDTAYDFVQVADVDVTNTDTMGAVSPGITVSPTIGLVTTEAGDSATFEVSLDAPPTGDVSMSLSVLPSTPSSRIVGALSTSSLTFTRLNWATPQAVTVTGINDIINDLDQDYIIDIATAVSGDAGYILDPANVSVTNLNDDDIGLPTVTITHVDAPEGAAGYFTFTRNGDTSNSLDVSFDYTGGTATVGVDFASLGGNPVIVTIPAGSASVDVDVQPVKDYMVEVSESVTITLNDLSSTYSLGTATRTLNIIDDDTAGILVTPSSGLVTTETGMSDTFKVRLTSEPSDNVTVTLINGDSTEIAILPTSLSLLFTPDNWSVPQTVTLVGLADTDDGILPGADKAYTVTLNAASTDGDYDPIDGITVSGKNLDVHDRQSVSVLATSAAVDEGSTGLAKFTVTRAVATGTALDVFFNASGGTALANFDFLETGTKVTISKDSTRADIIIDPIDDALVEGDETVVLKLVNGKDYLAAKPFSDTVTITDDETSLPPLANFEIDQAVVEGTLVTVNAYLSSPATSQVTIPYTVTGTATDALDHDAVNGSIVINSGTSGSATFNALTDAVSDNGETVVFTMGTLTNARPGMRNSHVVTINDENVQPVVSLSATQAGSPTHLITTGDGNVTVTATVTDLNGTDTHSYDWTASNAALVDIPEGGTDNPATFVFNPSGLSNGNFYAVRLTVTDNGTPALATPVDLLLEVDVPPSLTSTKDSDNDGITDDIESYDDSDGDGIADYLDPSTLDSNELQMYATQADTYIIRTETGLTLKLGETALAAGSDGVLVTADEIIAYGGGEGQPGANSTDSVANSGGYFDFEISGLLQAGQAVRVVLPQLAPLPAGAVYRKYDAVSGWRDYGEDIYNILYSAPGSPGVCPLPGALDYKPGLAEGHYCVQLMIRDGGPNDMDDPGSANGLVNFIIKDPAQLGIKASASDNNSDITINITDSSGGGVMSAGFLIVIGIYLLGVAGRRRALKS